MKKLIAVLMAAMLAATLFVSCDSNVDSKVDETVSVNFDPGRSRNLTASLEGFVKGDLYWKYTAVKDDETDLESGATGEGESNALWIKDENTQGLDCSVGGFSQGKWKFALYGYKKDSGGSFLLAYQGEAFASLKKDSDNAVLVTVSPVKATAKGTLEIDSANIKITKDGAAIAGVSDEKVVQVYKVVKVGGSDATAFGTTTSYELDPGAYKVTVAFVDSADNATYTYASGSVVATVYSNLTTKVKGNLEELRTSATFDSEINPDVMNTVATGESVDYATVSATSASAVTLSDKDESTGKAEKVTASVPASAVADTIKEIVGEENAAGSSVSLALSVDTTNATASTLELDISVSATVTDSSGNATTQSVSSLSDYSTVTISLQKALASVSVTHSGNAMDSMESADATPTNEANGGYHYDAATGVLTIKTKNFSPFAVSYTAPVYEAMIGSKNYASLQDALDSVKDKETIKLKGNVTSNTGFLFKNNVTATLDLNGYTLKVTNDTTNNHRAIKITNGALTIQNGTIDARNVDSDGNPADYNKSLSENYTDGIYGTIRVEGNAAKAVLDGLTLYNNHCWGMSVKVCTGNTAEINDCTFISSVGGCVEAEGGTITITKSTFEQTGTSKYSSYVSTGIAVSYRGQVTVNNSGFDVSGSHALYVYSSGGEITVSGGSYSSYGEYAVVVVNFDSGMYGLEGSKTDKRVTQEYLTAHDNMAARVIINDGTFTGSFKKEGSGVDLTDIVINDGTFSVDPSDYVAEGKKAVKYSDETWVIVNEDVVAEVDGEFCTDLKSAVENANDGIEIKLLDDITGNVDLSGKKLTFDFNGHTINGNVFIGCSSAAFYSVGEKNPSTVVFKDSGEGGGVKNTDLSCAALSIRNNSSVTIEGGSFVAEGETDSGKKGDAVILVFGSTLTINGGSFVNRASGNYNNYGDIISVGFNSSDGYETSATIKITGGSFSTDSVSWGRIVDVPHTDSTLNLTIDGGTFETDGTWGYLATKPKNGKIIVNQCEFTAKGAGQVFDVKDCYSLYSIYSFDEKDNIEVNGGKFTIGSGNSQDTRGFVYCNNTLDSAYGYVSGSLKLNGGKINCGTIHTKILNESNCTLVQDSNDTSYYIVTSINN